MCSDVAAGSHVLDEAERSLHDALCVLSQTVQDARVVYGGGFPEMQMAKVSHVTAQLAQLGSFGDPLTFSQGLTWACL